MFEQKRVLIVIVCAGLAMLGTLIWRAVYSIKHKGDEKALEAMTKAQAGSSWTLWFWFICWEGFAPYIFGENAVFSIGRVGYVIMFLVGTQCLSELFYAYYYTKMVKTKKTDNEQANTEQA